MKWKWNENEMKMKWKWNENEMKMKWKWNENEMKMKWKWNENEMKMKKGAKTFAAPYRVERNYANIDSSTTPFSYKPIWKGVRLRPRHKITCLLLPCPPHVTVVNVMVTWRYHAHNFARCQQRFLMSGGNSLCPTKKAQNWCCNNLLFSWVPDTWAGNDTEASSTENLWAILQESANELRAVPGAEQLTRQVQKA